MLWEGRSFRSIRFLRRKAIPPCFLVTSTMSTDHIHSVLFWSVKIIFWKLEKKKSFYKLVISHQNLKFKNLPIYINISFNSYNCQDVNWLSTFSDAKSPAKFRIKDLTSKLIIFEWQLHKSPLWKLGKKKSVIPFSTSIMSNMKVTSYNTDNSICCGYTSTVFATDK